MQIPILYRYFFNKKWGHLLFLLRRCPLSRLILYSLNKSFSFQDRLRNGFSFSFWNQLFNMWQNLAQSLNESAEVANWRKFRKRAIFAAKLTGSEEVYEQTKVVAVAPKRSDYSQGYCLTDLCPFKLLALYCSHLGQKRHLASL